LTHESIPEYSGAVDDSVNPAIAACHPLYDGIDRCGIGYIASKVRCLDSSRVQIREGLGDLRCPVAPCLRRRSPQEDQPGHKGRETAGQMCADSCCSTGHDNNVTRAQFHVCRIHENHRSQLPFRGENPAVSMHDLNHGAASVQRTRQRNSKVGIPLDFHAAKLHRRVFLRGTQKQPEHPLRQQSTVYSGSFTGIHQ